MLTTDQLEKRIKKIIYRVLPNADMDSINFSIGTANSPEGAYFFSQDNKYHYVFTEKGTIRNHEELETEDEILWIVLEQVLFDIALNYAVNNKVSGKDFRRVLFAKELDLYAMFGAAFQERKEQEIKEILEKNPYFDGHDNMVLN